MDDLRKGLQLIVLVGILLYAEKQGKRMDEAVNTIREQNTVISKQDTTINMLKLKIDTVMNLHPWHKPRNKKWSGCPGNFLGFILYKNVDIRITEDLKEALENYSGPKVMITSLRRNWGTKSDHEHGKAVDFDLSEELVNFLISEDGKKWREAHGLKMYIEGKPGCNEVKKYLERPECADYVFFNPNATGSHIHLDM